MGICGQRQYDLLEKFAFNRVAGSPEEKVAVKILEDEIKSIGFEPTIEPFTRQDYIIKKVSFEVTEPYHKVYEVAGYQGGKDTPEEGIECELYYAENLLEANLVGVKGKLVLSNVTPNPQQYEKLINAGALGVVTISGALLDDLDKTDLPNGTFRPGYLKFGSMYGFNVRVKDAVEMVMKEASKVKVCMISEPVTYTCYNICVTVPGTTYPDQIVSFASHHDSVPFSHGANDNGSGCVIIMEILRYFKENPPARTLKFNWFGGEEMGLKGSAAWCEAHKDELPQHVFMINVDVAGAAMGRDSVAVMASQGTHEYIEALAKEIGHPILVNHEIYSGDCISFASKGGIPTVTFARGGASGAAYIHNRNDQMFFISPKALAHTTTMMLELAKRVANATVFPFPREIPEDLQKQIESYLTKL